MLQDTDLFERFEQWFTLGDVHPTIQWAESPSPDERYEVNVLWRYRSSMVGQGTFIIEPILNSEDYRLWWIHLAFKEDWQGKGLYTDIVKRLAPGLLTYNVIETQAQPWDTESQRRLASQGFEWRGNAFVLDHRSVAS